MNIQVDWVFTVDGGFPQLSVLGSGTGGQGPRMDFHVLF